MPTPEQATEYRAARERYDTAADELRRQLVSMALATLAEVLPGAESIDAQGEYDEDLVATLRVQRVRSVTGEVLFDANDGHSDRAVEDAVDEVDIEYLDALTAISSGRYLGDVTITAPADPDPR
jgi:hypothetical protein